MAFITADRVKDTSTTTGTGNITVSGSAPFGYRTFSTVLSVSDTFYYCIQGQSTSEWEVGLGTYVSTNQFARTTILSSSASGSAVSFSSGTKNVFITLPANKTLQFDASGSPTAGGILYGTGSMLSYSAVGTAGQALVSGGTGAPTWATVTGLGTVTSVNVSGGTTGLTTSGGPVTTSGTITLAGTLAAANGGTGLTSPGTSGNVLTSNGSAWVSQAPSGGSGTSISNGTSNVTIASSNGAITTSTNGTTAMTVDTSQNVLVGTTVAYSPLTVNGSNRFDTVTFGDITTAANNCGVYLRSTGAAGISWASGGYLAFFGGGVGTTERARIDTNGNLLVGVTTSPAGKINFRASSAQGSYSCNTYLQNTWSGDATYPGLYIAKYDSSTATTQVFVKFAINNDTNGSGQINANGASAAAFGSFSDERLKENIVNLPSQLANICALRPVEFDYKDGSGHQIGFVAQEMQIVYPDVVGAGANDMLTITGWSKTEARLVAAIQELSAKNDALEARLAALEAK